MSRFVTVARVDDVPENGTCGVMAEDLAIALIRSGGEIYALEDCCSHEEFPLSDGEVEAGEITCLLHGARFDLATGAPRALPAVMPVRRFDVRIDGDDIQGSPPRPPTAAMRVRPRRVAAGISRRSGRSSPFSRGK